MESHGKAPLVLGSRGSALALKQVDLVTEALEEGGCDGRPIHVEIISTTGDRRQDLRLASPDLDKAVFTKELEEALHAKQIHVAIHSLKDVPTQLEEEFAICAVLPRAPIEDVLITREAAWCEEGLRSLPSGAVVGTSSLRRSFQLQAIRPDVVVKEIRGNVPTRLAKVADADGEGFDATLLARAGLERLGFSTEGSSLVLESGEVVGLSRIPATEILPAASQGAVAMEVRSEDVESQEIFRRINHGETWR
ncbi:MAG: hydroxymethylbilane synthase, partial [Verrucomicrobiota bacterium]